MSFLFQKTQTGVTCFLKTHVDIGIFAIYNEVRSSQIGSET